MANRWGNNGKWQALFSWVSKSLQVGTAAMQLKDTCSLEETHWKDPDAGKDWGQEETGVMEDEVVGWYRRLNGHERESEVQGSLACCSPCRGHRVRHWWRKTMAEGTGQIGKFRIWNLTLHYLGEPDRITKALVRGRQMMRGRSSVALQTGR